MIEEERSPALRRRAPASGHVLGYRGLAYVDAELEEFSMDARSAPERICQAHLADQLPNFERHLGPAGSYPLPLTLISSPLTACVALAAEIRDFPPCAAAERFYATPLARTSNTAPVLACGRACQD